MLVYSRVIRSLFGYLPDWKCKRFDANEISIDSVLAPPYVISTLWWLTLACYTSNNRRSNSHTVIYWQSNSIIVINWPHLLGLWMQNLQNPVLFCGGTVCVGATVTQSPTLWGRHGASLWEGVQKMTFLLETPMVRIWQLATFAWLEDAEFANRRSLLEWNCLCRCCSCTSTLVMGPASGQAFSEGVQIWGLARNLVVQ